MEGRIQWQIYQDKGVILKIDPEHIFKYSHYSPASGKPDASENYHFVTIYLADGADRTEVSLTQDNNHDEKERLASEKNWGVMLEGLKKYVEAKAAMSTHSSLRLLVPIQWQNTDGNALFAGIGRRG